MQLVCWGLCRGWVKAVKLDERGKIESISVMPRIGLGQPTNLKIGSKGRLHVLYFNREGMGHLVRLENKGKVSVQLLMIQFKSQTAFRAQSVKSILVVYLWPTVIV